jgi:hypothetical protein
MSSGMPRILSGSSIPARRSWTKPSDETIRDAARGSCWPRSGVGSFLNIAKAGYVQSKPKEYAIFLLKDKEGIEREDNRIAMGEIRFIPGTKASV